MGTSRHCSLVGCKVRPWFGSLCQALSGPQSFGPCPWLCGPCQGLHVRHRQAKPVEHMGAASVDDGRCVAETNAPNIGKVARPYFPTDVFGVLSPAPVRAEGSQVGVVTGTAGVGYLNIYGRHKGTPPAPNPEFDWFSRRVVSERAARIVKKWPTTPARRPQRQACTLVGLSLWQLTRPDEVYLKVQGPLASHRMQEAQPYLRDVFDLSPSFVVRKSWPWPWSGEGLRFTCLVRLFEVVGFSTPLWFVVFSRVLGFGKIGGTYVGGIYVFPCSSFGVYCFAMVLRSSSFKMAS